MPEIVSLLERLIDFASIIAYILYNINDNQKHIAGWEAERIICPLGIAMASAIL
jgi:hypothetical protein